MDRIINFFADTYAKNPFCSKRFAYATISEKNNLGY